MKVIVTIALIVFSTAARADLPIYVDYYDAKGRIIKSEWYCPVTPMPGCQNKQPPKRKPAKQGFRP